MSPHTSTPGEYSRTEGVATRGGFRQPGSAAGTLAPCCRAVAGQRDALFGGSFAVHCEAAGARFSRTSLRFLCSALHRFNRSRRVHAGLGGGLRGLCRRQAANPSDQPGNNTTHPPGFDTSDTVQRISRRRDALRGRQSKCIVSKRAQRELLPVVPAARCLRSARHGRDRLTSIRALSGYAVRLSVAMAGRTSFSCRPTCGLRLRR